MFRKVFSQTFRFLCHRLVYLRFRKALCGVGFDAWNGVAHTEVVKPPIGIIELLAYLCQCVKVAPCVFRICECVTYGLFVVACWNEFPLAWFAFRLLLSLLSGNGNVLCIQFSSFIFFSVFLLRLANGETLRLQ